MRDLRALITWLLHEARAAAGFAREREIWIALASGLLLWTLAYQLPYTHRIDLGGNLQTGRRYDASDRLHPVDWKTLVSEADWARSSCASSSPTASTSAAWSPSETRTETRPGCRTSRCTTPTSRLAAGDRSPARH